MFVERKRHAALIHLLKPIETLGPDVFYVAWNVSGGSAPFEYFTAADMSLGQELIQHFHHLHFFPSSLGWPADQVAHALRLSVPSETGVPPLRLLKTG